MARVLSHAVVWLVAVVAGAGCQAAPPAQAAPAESEQTPTPSAQPATTGAVEDPKQQTCGEKGLPDCPTQLWMKSNLQAHVRAKDFKRLTKGLEKLAGAPPDGYQGWQQSAQRALQAAQAEDMSAVKAECKSCHTEHRKRFRAERRTVPLQF